MIGCSPTSPTHDSLTMGIIYHSDSSIFFSKSDYLRQGSQIAVHGEDSIGDDEDFLIRGSPVAGNYNEDFLQVFHVAMLINIFIFYSGETDGINDRRMI